MPELYGLDAFSPPQIAARDGKETAAPAHARAAHEVLADLGSGPRGLDSARAAERLARHFMQPWFATRPVAPLDGALVLACGIAFLVLLEGEKWLLRRPGPLQPAT